LKKVFKRDEIARGLGKHVPPTGQALPADEGTFR